MPGMRFGWSVVGFKEMWLGHNARKMEMYWDMGWIHGNVLYEFY